MLKGNEAIIGGGTDHPDGWGIYSPITVVDLFACFAAMGFSSRAAFDDDAAAEQVAKSAYRVAYKMIEEREK